MAQSKAFNWPLACLLAFGAGVGLQPGAALYQRMQRPEAPVVPLTSESVQLYFSPKGGATEAICEQIEAVKSTLYVQAYSFTSAPIAKALVEAHRRGVKVQVILDKGQKTEKYSSADFLQHASVPTFIDARHSIAHNKVMILDEGTVLTGSFNFTSAAEEHNAENLLVIRSQTLAKQYLENWRRHLEHSERY
ncbi:MAG TPA: phospholipase D family protein [Planctomycetota bacterium]|jgi:phosphatidylserine/phosphatidylglycerophosphate/cardiolipin synthase-like enzyme